MMKPIQQTKDIIQKVQNFLGRTPWSQQYLGRLECLKDRTEVPSELAVAGRVKAGKSSFLNALLGQDLALVGTTETTATVNFFKFGSPQSMDTPVKVVWDDGSEEWKGRDFLNSLQGHSSESLRIADKIDHFEYFINDPLLSSELGNITLVDTPGTDALVDEHNARTESYMLRQKHDNQTVKLKERADAVIILVRHVQDASTKRIVEEFTDGTSAFNAIGVMSKIDDEGSVSIDEWNSRCRDYSQKLHDKLSCVMPVSAGVYHWTRKLQKNGRISLIQSRVRQIPDLTPEEFGELFMSTNYENKAADPDIEDMYESFGLPKAVRLDLYAGMEGCYSVFVKIAQELYFHPMEEAIQRLVEYSGMEKLKAVLNEQFFKRSRVIRCSGVLSELHAILVEIQRDRVPEVRKESQNRNEYIALINRFVNIGNRELISSLQNLVERNTLPMNQLSSHEQGVSALIREVESLQLLFRKTDNKSEGLMLLEKHRDYFSPNEIHELEHLFGMHPDSHFPLDRRRQSYWQSKLSCRNLEIKQIIRLAISAYGSMA